VNMCAMFPFSLHLPSVPNPLRPAHQRPLKPLIGWITYLPANLATRAKYPTDVEVETLEDGAALVTLCEELFDKDDAEGLARLHALEAALRPIQS
jgi:Immunity protein 52